MTLLEIVEDRQAELETELRMCREILVILRRGKTKSALKHSPIVYGNGYHDGKKPLTVKGTPRKAPPTQGIKGLTVDKVWDILKSSPKGLTLEQIQTILAEKDNIKISTSSVYNAFRRRNVEKITVPGFQAKVYRAAE